MSPAEQGCICHSVCSPRGAVTSDGDEVAGSGCCRLQQAAEGEGGGGCYCTAAVGTALEMTICTAHCGWEEEGERKEGRENGWTMGKGITCMERGWGGNLVKEARLLGQAASGKETLQDCIANCTSNISKQSLLRKKHLSYILLFADRFSYFLEDCAFLCTFNIEWFQCLHS
jgi:hypothetical protein